MRVWWKVGEGVMGSGGVVESEWGWWGGGVVGSEWGWVGSGGVGQVTMT